MQEEILKRVIFLKGSNGELLSNLIKEGTQKTLFVSNKNLLDQEDIDDIERKIAQLEIRDTDKANALRETKLRDAKERKCHKRLDSNEAMVIDQLSITDDYILNVYLARTKAWEWMRFMSDFKARITGSGEIKKIIVFISGAADDTKEIVRLISKREGVIQNISLRSDNSSYQDWDYISVVANIENDLIIVNTSTVVGKNVEFYRRIAMARLDNKELQEKYELQFMEFSVADLNGSLAKETPTTSDSETEPAKIFGRTPKQWWEKWTKPSPSHNEQTT